jgi:hypothetical protein
MRSRFIFVAVVFCLSCPGQKPPGDELMGTFNFTATPVSSNCAEVNAGGLSEVPDGGFTFDATFSRNKNPGTQAWVTVYGTSRDATYDGGYVFSELMAPRTFVACAGSVSTQPGCPTVAVDEVFQVVLLSASQDALLGSTCPPSALDGGVPGPDAGATPPSSQPSGFDAVRACGLLSDSILPDAGCFCRPCSFVYSVEGKRK